MKPWQLALTVACVAGLSWLGCRVDALAGAATGLVATIGALCVLLWVSYLRAENDPRKRRGDATNQTNHEKEGGGTDRGSVHDGAPE